MKRNKRGRFVSVAMAQKMERLSEAQQQRWVRTERPGPEAGAPPGGAEAPEPGLESATPLVVTTSYCRLCHGKFSSRSLRNAFAKVPLVEANPEMQRRAQQTFGADFQKLVGVVVRQDPTLPQYICRNCHAQFYKCRSILRNYIQRVNTSPVASVQRGQESSRCVAATKSSSMQSLSQSPLDNSISDDFKRMLNDGSVSASPQCLQVLVTWAHHHGSSCGSPPNVQSVLSAAYCGVVGAVWGCPEGHSYILDVHPNHNIALSEGQYPYNKNNDSKKEEIVGSALPLPPHNGTVDQINCNKASCSVKDDIADGLESSDLSDRYLSSEDDGEEKVKNGSSDESFQPYWEKNKVPTKKCDSKDVKKTPGQKRGRKPKSNSEREDFPTMYRCQYKGCCAIYRGADGLKKHIKEHHEEVRERPCPHPGCNKVFLIDRYLQRHVKLIHTEERNYICDECGQTFKQRKHLSVHQMRHSGAKPLQCEICGFQCRQRASLKYHMTKHKAEAELDFACDQCGKRFEKAHNLNVHMSMVHPLTQNTDKSKPAECVETEPNQLSTETFIEWEPS
ncbi:zinc finger protein 276 isoform X2 [Carcharodon carcharias]|uniref:zinc finger protein 276 isoform X2 n=1 Tax=Carcharodon carcharias TaxID=13397 RepID=UPI001B7D9C95|nr:zinc finger protein 276 isoform X2 [Carcharodon carcharias]